MTRIAVALAAASIIASVGSASAGGYGYGGYGYSPSYSYHPVYKTVCQPIFATKQVYDPYYYTYKTITVKVGENCRQVQVY
jgi:hypothetical protein